MDAVCRGRFAPSPSGRMHLGNAFAALLAWLSVRHAGGVMLMRVEDLDTQRCRPEYARQLMEDLTWLGLDWDEGPVWQSQRTGRYVAALERLKELDLVYPCYCTRAERLASSAPHMGEETVYPDLRCRSLSQEQRAELEAQGKRPAWRVAGIDKEIDFTDKLQGLQRQNLAADCGSFILRRSDGLFAYQLAVSVDDGEMGVTQVVRGRDLLDSAPRQIWLLEALGHRAPEYCHVPLLVAPDGRRLAKRDGDLDLGALRARHRPEEVVGLLAHWAGLLPTPQPVKAAELVADFHWSKVPRHDIVVKEVF